MKHQGLLALFRNHPALAPQLLQGLLGQRLPPWSEARLAPADFPQVVPSGYRADLVVQLLKTQPRPTLSIIVEVQLSKNPGKHNIWPLYLASACVQEDCPALLLVVAPKAAVARWCARALERHPGFTIRPLILGPEQIPVIMGPREAGKDPELAVLSALTHGHNAEQAPELFEAVVTSARGLDKRRSTFYVDLALSSFSGEVRRALEATMQRGTYEYQTEFVRNFVAQGLEQGRQEGLEQGLEQGLERGRQEGLEQGEQKGRLEGERRALFQVLEARGLKVEGGARRRLMACTDLSQFERWLSLAVKVQSVQQLFKHEGTPQHRARTPASRPRARRPRAKR
jgi:hypothetical protein